MVLLISPPPKLQPKKKKRKNTLFRRERSLEGLDPKWHLQWLKSVQSLSSLHLAWAWFSPLQVIYPSVLVLRVHIANLKRLFNFYPLFSTDIKKLLSLTKILTSSHKFVFDCLQVCSGRAVVCQRDHTLSSELVSTSQRGS